MNINERNKLFKQMMKEDYELQAKKGHDYAKDEDSLYNLRKRGLLGILVRLEDKLCRFDSFLEKEIYKVKEESLIDTLRDIRVYAYLAQILYEKQAGRELPPPGTIIEYDEKTGIDKNGNKVI